jgi:hypothetical protein
MKIATPLVVLMLLIGLSPERGLASVCVYKPPKVRQVHGRVVDPSNEPIPGVTVRLKQGDVTVATATTDSIGSFSFASLQDGDYYLNASIAGFHPAGYVVILRHQTRRWKQSLRVKLAIGIDQCAGSIEVVKPAELSR